jgi:hypothetical protein
MDPLSRPEANLSPALSRGEGATRFGRSMRESGFGRFSPAMPAKPALIAGIVRDARGRPVPQARVYFTSGPGAVPDIAALTDDSGAFCLSVPLAGIYTVASTAEGFESAEVKATANPGGKTVVEIKLQN